MPNRCTLGQAHEQPVISLAATALDEDRCLALTGGADERVYVWSIRCTSSEQQPDSEAGEAHEPVCSLQQCIATPGRIQHSMAVAEIARGW